MNNDVQEQKKLQKRSLVDIAYESIKSQILNFDLLPGDRFTETEISTQLETSRTPVREALSRLEQETYVKGYFKSGWQVVDFDFHKFEELYDLRIILETSVVDRLCRRNTDPPQLDVLLKKWAVTESDQLTDENEVCELDEEFHRLLIQSIDNKEIIRVHQSIEERIHLIRRLDFTLEKRIQITYSEHQRILSAILARDHLLATCLITEHIRHSRDQIKNISLSRLKMAQKLRTGKAGEIYSGE